jgi:hypothetical protein
VARGGFHGGDHIRTGGGQGRGWGCWEADEAAAGEEKKGSEPYAMPTTGAFYIHDDRFKEAHDRGPVRGHQRFRLFLNLQFLFLVFSEVISMSDLRI